MWNRRLALTLTAWIGLGGGCYTSHPVEEVDGGPCANVDPGDPPWHGSDARTWIRTEGSGADARYQAVVLDSIDPGAVTCNMNIVLLEATPEGAMVQEAGRVLDGGATLRVTRRYQYDPEASVPLLDREGARMEEVAEEHAFEATFDGDVLRLSLDGVERSYDRLAARIAAIDASSQAGAEAIAGLLQFALLSSWSRVVGWGSSNLLAYVDTPTRGACALRGETSVVVHVAFSAEIVTTHDGCFDFREISLAGTSTMDTVLPGDGAWHGSVVYTLVADPTDPTTTLTGTLFLDGLEVSDLQVSGGTATLRVGVASFIIDASHFQTLQPW